MKKSKRVVIDTNLWISYLIKNGYTRLDKAILNQEIKLLFSTELIDEFIEVTSRSKLRA